MTTSTRLTLALSRVPTNNSPATTKQMITAGRLISPPCSGPFSRTSGMPAAWMKGTTCPAQPTATALHTTVYSSIRLQPTTQASISPSTA